MAPARLFLTGLRGFQQHSARRYGTYKSKFGPKYKVEPNYHGITFDRAINYGMLAALFGVAAGSGLLMFGCDIPRVRDDIMKKIPLLGEYFVIEIPPEDNPF